MFYFHCSETSKTWRDWKNRCSNSYVVSWLPNIARPWRIRPVSKLMFYDHNLWIKIFHVKASICKPFIGKSWIENGCEIAPESSMTDLICDCDISTDAGFTSYFYKPAKIIISKVDPKCKSCYRTILFYFVGIALHIAYHMRHMIYSGNILYMLGSKPWKLSLVFHS